MGIESTAHSFGAGLVTFEGEFLSVRTASYSPPEGGLHPQVVADHHAKVFPEVISGALADAGASASDVRLVAFSQGPGLGGCLRVGALIARALSLRLGVPLVGVNHCVAHVEVGRLTRGVEDPLVLYVSGGNTIVTAFAGGRYQVFGETLDVAIGNMLDAFARKAGIPHPGGPRLERLAQNSDAFLDLPYVVKGMDLSFSGLYTAACELLASGHPLEDVANSLQEVAFAMLAEVTERALAHSKKEAVLLTGGVAANRRLQQMIRHVAEEHGAEFHVVEPRLAGDNGAMIAWTGVLQYLSRGPTSVQESAPKPRWRLEDVSIPWRKGEAGGP